MKDVKRGLVMCLLAAPVVAAIAKLPPLSDEAKAKAAEAAAKTAWGDKVAAYQLCQSQDKVAAKYRSSPKGCGLGTFADGFRIGARHRRVCRPRAVPAADGCSFCGVGCVWCVRRAADHRRGGSGVSCQTQVAAGGCNAPGASCVASPAYSLPMQFLPRLTEAKAPLTRQIEVLDEFGARRAISIPAERALTVFVDRRELVTLMTLGASPELLVLGYLRNQRLVESVGDIDSITVDWDVGAAAVKTRAGIERFDEKTAKRVVTTGCGQGTVFGDLMGELDKLVLPRLDDPAGRLSQSTLYSLLNAVRLQESTYKSAGSVHACALFEQDRLLCFVEDVGRHNAIDTIAGWMWMNLDAAGVAGGNRIFYTTGRLTSEMVIKSAQMGVAIIVSRSGITQMGHELATRLGLCLFGRATNRHFICYSGFERFDAEPEPARETQAG